MEEGRREWRELEVVFGGRGGRWGCVEEQSTAWKSEEGVALTSGSTSGLNPQERQTCQQVNYLICPWRHALPFNYCLASPGRRHGDRILQAHIWNIMDANRGHEDIIKLRELHHKCPGVRTR